MDEMSAAEVVRKARVEFLKSHEWLGWKGHEGRCVRCQASRDNGHTAECDLVAELTHLKAEGEYQRLEAIVDAAQSLRLNANAHRIVHSNVDYIPAYLLAPLCEALDDLDALDEEDKEC